MNIFGGQMQQPNEAILVGNEPVGQDAPEGFKRPRIGDVLSIHLSQKANSAAVWTIQVFVQIAQGMFELGPAIITNPPTGGDPPGRTVGFGACPGAIGWKVVATCPTNDEIADLVIQSSECCGGSNFGVTPNVFVVETPE